MCLGERKVSPHVAQVVCKRREQFADNTFGQTAVRALVVAVLDESDRRIRSTADVITRGIDVIGQVDDVLVGARVAASALMRGGGQ
jgi:hypothetical protein